MSQNFMDEVWHGVTSLHWMPDALYRPDRALYAGDLYVGLIQHLPHPTRHELKSWCGWIMTNESGKDLGWFETEQAAKDALVDAAVKALCG